MSVEIVGVDSLALIEFAKAAAADFQHREVLVKDYASGGMAILERILMNDNLMQRHAGRPALSLPHVPPLSRNP